MFILNILNNIKNQFVLNAEISGYAYFQWCLRIFQVYEKSQRVGFALYELGYRKGDLVGISAMNKPEVNSQFLDMFPQDRLLPYLQYTRTFP